jgi:hypothetical protein
MSANLLQTGILLPLFFKCLLQQPHLKYEPHIKKHLVLTLRYLEMSVSELQGAFLPLNVAIVDEV